MIKFEDDLKYGVWTTIDADAGTGWHRKFKELEQWCKDNCSGKFVIVQPTPLERVFVFDDETEAMAFKLMWS